MLCKPSTLWIAWVSGKEAPPNCCYNLHILIRTHTHTLNRVSGYSCNRLAICRLKQSFCAACPGEVQLQQRLTRFLYAMLHILRVLPSSNDCENAHGLPGVKTIPKIIVEVEKGRAEQLFDKHLGREWQQNATRVAKENFRILCTLIFGSYQRK